MTTALATAHPLLLPTEGPELGDRAVEIRREGRETFERVGLPTVRQEGWRQTNVAPLGKTVFRDASAVAPPGEEKLAPFRMEGTIELVFVNGRLDRERSAAGLAAPLPEGVVVGDLATGAAECPEVLDRVLGRVVDADHPFVALNSAHLGHGAFVHVPRGVRVETPLHFVFLATTGGGEAVAGHPRNVFVVGETAEATIVESYVGFAGETTLTVPVSEIAVGPAGVLDHYKIGEDGLDAWHVAVQGIRLERDATFFSHGITHGGKLVRNDIHARLDGEGIDCTLNGLYLARGRQHVDNQMRVDHLKPNCHSWELYKGILEDRARAVFSGRIYVAEDAQKTDAKQSNRNLLLSDEALVQSNPQLEIFADDVRCTHGSTTGHLEDEAIFYLRSRGIGEDAAKSLLTYAFAAEVLQEIRLEPMRRTLEEFLFTRLPRGEVVRQAV